MVDRPRLFSAPMVRALLGHRKTETRRILSPQNVRFLGSDGPSFAPSKALLSDAQKEIVDFRRVGTPDAPVWIWKGPAYPYQPGPYTNWHCYTVDHVGDRLWVRETLTRSGGYIQYEADKTLAKHGTRMWPAHWKQDPRPSIHMPRWASRLTLEVAAVLLERLQEITDSGAEAEGMYSREVAVDGGRATRWFNGLDDGAAYSSPRAAYEALWCWLHGPASWSANPLVIVTAFAVRLCNIDKLESAA